MEKNESLPKINRDTNPQSLPKQFRRLERARKNRYIKRRNDGKAIGSGLHNTIGLTMWDGRAIYFPRNKKLKGWQKENRKYNKTA